MRIFSILFLILFFIGCIESDNKQSVTPITTEQNASTIINEPLLYQQWSINHNTTFYAQNNINDNAHINAGDIFSKYTGKGIKVAVIDNGFDVNHPEIKDKIIEKIAISSTGNVSTDVSHTLASESHGTAVAGIIAADDNNIGIRGIAPDVELILIKYPPYGGTDASFIAQFDQAINYGADIINCSWGTGAVSDTVRDYIKTISSTARGGKGVIIVFASGNGGSDHIGDNMQNDESAISTVIGVGATERDNLRTLYSDYGNELDIVAPGGRTLGITTIDPIGSFGATNDDYNRYNEYKNGSSAFFKGTSASAPIISGVLALALEKNKNLTREQLQNILKYSTDTIGDDTPYLDEMINSSSSFPTITGLLGTSGNSEIKVQLTSESNITYGPYLISLINGDNTFSSTVTDDLSEGNYTIEIINTNNTLVYATNEDFEINSSKPNESNSSIRKSDYYGYGKINLEKFMDNINSDL